MSAQRKQMQAIAQSLVSLSQAAKLTPYSAEYLSLLARKGRLTAVKINRDWLTTQQAVLDYVKKQEIKHQKLIRQLRDAERRLV